MLQIKLGHSAAKPETFGGGINANIGNDWKQETVDQNASSKAAFAQEGSYHLVHIPLQNQCSDLYLAQGEEYTDGVWRKVNMPKSSWSAAVLILHLCVCCTLLWPFFIPRGTGLEFQWQRQKNNAHIHSPVYQLTPVTETSSFQWHTAAYTLFELSQLEETHPQHPLGAQPLPHWRPKHQFLPAQLITDFMPAAAASLFKKKLSNAYSSCTSERAASQHEPQCQTVT